MNEENTVISSREEHCLQAVSYTHLDVYKRQDLCRRIGGAAILILLLDRV